MSFIRALPLIFVVSFAFICSGVFAQEQKETNLDSILGKNTESSQNIAVMGFSYEQCKKMAAENKSQQSSEEFMDNCVSFSAQNNSDPKRQSSAFVLENLDDSKSRTESSTDLKLQNKEITRAPASNPSTEMQILPTESESTPLQILNDSEAQGG